MVQNYEWLKEREEAVTIAEPTIFSSIILIGSIGNSFILYVVAINKDLRCSKNLLIANLVIADLIFIVI